MAPGALRPGLGSVIPDSLKMPTAIEVMALGRWPRCSWRQAMVRLAGFPSIRADMLAVIHNTLIHHLLRLGFQRTGCKDRVAWIPAEGSVLRPCFRFWAQNLIVAFLNRSRWCSTRGSASPDKCTPVIASSPSAAPCRRSIAKACCTPGEWGQSARSYCFSDVSALRSPDPRPCR